MFYFNDGIFHKVLRKRTINRRDVVIQ